MPTSPFQATKSLLRDLAKSKIAVTRTGGPADSANASRAFRRIYVARGTADPVAKLAHESGHMKARPSPDDFFARMKAKVNGDAVSEARLTLKEEIGANKAAISGAKTYGVSRATVKGLRDTLKPYLGAYKSNLARELVKESGQNIYNNKALKLTRTGKKIVAAASRMDLTDIYERFRKNRIPGYADAKRRVSAANQDELKKSFAAGLLRKAFIELGRTQESAPVKSSGLNIVTVDQVGLFGDSPRRTTEFSAIDRLHDIRLPGKLPAPFSNGPAMILKRSWRMNKRVAGGVLRDVAIAGGAAYITNKIRDSEEERAKKRRDMSAQISAIMFGTRDAAVNRIVDATRDNLPAVELPGEAEIEAAKRVARAARKSALVRAAALKLAKIGAGAAGGAFLAHRLAPGGARIGATAGAIGGILFSSNPVLTGLAFAAKFPTTKTIL